MKPIRALSRFHDIPLHLHIAYLFVSLLMLFAIVSDGYHYYQTRQLMMDGARQDVDKLEQMIRVELSRLYQPTRTLVELLAHKSMSSSATVEEQQKKLLPFLTIGLKNSPFVSALYIGFENGNSLVVRPWREPSEESLAPRFKPPVGTVWIAQSRQGGNAGEYLYFDANLTLLGRSIRPDYQFDPRVRPWYRPALQSKGLVISEPYLDFSTHRAGVSFSRRLHGGEGVVGADIDLHTLDTLLEKSRLTPNTQLALLSKAGEVISWYGGVSAVKRKEGDRRILLRLAEIHSPVLQKLKQKVIELTYHDMPLPTRRGVQPREVGLSSSQNGIAPLLGKVTSHKDLIIKEGGETWQGAVVAFPTREGASLVLMIASPHDELLASAIAMRNNGLMIAALLLGLGILLALAFSRLASHPLRALMKEAGKIERFEFDQPLAIKTHILEVAQLVNAMGRMKSTIQHFLDLSLALSGETNFQRLLAFLLHETQEITHAQGGILYLTEANGQRLRAEQATWQEKTFDAIAGLAEIDLVADQNHPVANALHQECKTLSIPQSTIREYFSTLIPVNDTLLGLTMLVLPLNNRNGEKLGALILFVDEHKRPLTLERLAFAEAISSTASIALYTQGLINDQKVLLESFIQLIAGAIDAKSVYTGGHCQRVPELTKMLARAACAEYEGPFRDFNLTPDQWEELHIAAWLHDCGKVTTPEYVVDKATKLETIYDRIHEIRMRFEVLKRDAEIIYWKAIANGENAQEAQAILHTTWAQLDEDYAFVAASNEGGEFMAPTKVQRLQQIAQRTWQRTLSDRIGISQAEKTRKEQVPEPALPVEEFLLADKPEHILERGVNDQLPADNPWGFNVTVPEVLYNRGELYNLSVGRGTLSEEERYKINEHIIQTIIMLEKLPFPRHLRRVPEIAGGHHEKMDGTGYPKRLHGHEMSIEARIMAIADIFEALTAIDRPYKKGKKLSEALKIMHIMQKEQHIDTDLFVLFLRSGVYKEYAERYMRPEQVDEVDIDQYLSPLGSKK